MLEASNRRRVEIVSKSLYHDHVIFLGPGVPLFKSSENLKKFIFEIQEKGINPPPFIILEKYGLYESHQCVAAAREMIDCFVEVLIRINLGNEIKSLSKNQEDELLNWDAEKYRQTIN